MRCPACFRKVDHNARFCDACGATLNTSRMRRKALLGLAGAITLTAVVGGVAAQRWLSTPTATPEALFEAMSSAIASGFAPGLDPICVANGLAYDNEPVNVQLDNAATLAWMKVLVDAGLYAAPEEGQSGGTLSRPISIYQPLPELARWAGGRRLCVARAVRLDRISNVGPVEDMRLRGKRYPGVLADVRWTLDGAAPWLSRPGVGEALANELPGWRNARWQPGPEGWQLTQRKSFVRVDDHWTAGDAVERVPPTRTANGRS
jgi:hypothetical protein